MNEISADSGNGDGIDDGLCSNGRGSPTRFAASKVVACMMQLMDTLNIGVSLVGADCRPAMCNAKMMEMLSASEGFHLTPSGHFKGVDSQSTSAIKERLVTAVFAESGHYSCCAVSEDDGQSPLLLFASLAPSTMDSEDRPYAAVIAVDRRADQNISAQALTHLFGLTPSEAAAAEAIARGVGPGEYAVLKGISPNTVAAHIHNAMTKMGVSRQVDLVRISLSSLIWFSPRVVDVLFGASYTGSKQVQKPKY